MTLEVAGRRTGRLISFPVVVTDYEGERYLVSMLGNDANWVLRRGRREAVRLEEVDLGARARWRSSSGSAGSSRLPRQGSSVGLG